MPATFYILYSAALDRYYIGHTEDRLDGRIRRHNSDHKGFTGKARDWTPVFTEEFPSKIEAYARERQVKAWKSRTAIERLVSEKKRPGIDSMVRASRPQSGGSLVRIQ